MSSNLTTNLTNKNFNLKSLTPLPLFLGICYWLYVNISLGFFLSKIFYNFLNNSEFQKKFSFKNITKILINFFGKLIKNWCIRVLYKCLLLTDAVDGLIRAVAIFLRKFIKSPLKSKRNFRRLKKLLQTFGETFRVFYSLMNEVLFLNKLINWVIQWINLIELLMAESLFITGIVYVLYLILSGIFGIILGFLLGLLAISRRKDKVNELYVFLLLILLKILYNNGFDDVLLEPLRIRSLEPRNIEEFSKNSLEVCELFNSQTCKLFLGEFVKEPQIPLPFLNDLFVSIDIDFIFDESTNYEFELLLFYRNVNQKVKS